MCLATPARHTQTHCTETQSKHTQRRTDRYSHTLTHILALDTNVHTRRCVIFICPRFCSTCCSCAHASKMTDSVSTPSQRGPRQKRMDVWSLPHRELHLPARWLPEGHQQVICCSCLGNSGASRQDVVPQARHVVYSTPSTAWHFIIIGQTALPVRRSVPFTKKATVPA